ncbi:outer membrane lipoprotein carrier protein LolA [Geothrix sp.]|jgi:outer membrane lipoprotein-sorting protein|uniref:LolA family protein n=1 Tax=Geothrix sp. TaxID=1962974 RepID=UPI0025C0A7A9|nr:outer membrane lipoprotein carrier protein LolA [Geothrix sp.]
MIRRLSFLFCLALSQVAPAAPPPLREAVERFDAAQAQVQTLQCPFTLTLRRALLKTPSVTKGTLYLQGSDFVHFAFQPPEDLILHLTPKALVSYSPGAGEGELMKIGLIRNADRKFLGLGQKLSYLSEYFQIRLEETRDLPGTWFLAMVPRTLSMRKRMQALNLWVDKETWLPRQVQWIERSGDSWLVELGALRTNQALPAAVTGFKLPEGIPVRSDFSFFATRKK